MFLEKVEFFCFDCFFVLAFSPCPLQTKLTPSHLRGGVDLGKAHVWRSRHVPHDAASALDADVEQRRRRRCERGVACTRLARAGALAHQRGAGSRHDGPDVGEVDVDLDDFREIKEEIKQKRVRFF